MKAKIKKFKKKNLKNDQIPYFEASMQEFHKIKEEYKLWLNNLPTSSGKLFGCSDESPFPEFLMNIHFMDLTERIEPENQK